MERGAVTKSQKGTKTNVERKVEECYQGKEDLCSFRHDSVRLLLQIDGKIPLKSSSSRGESPSGTRGRIPCRKFFMGR